MCVPRLKGLRLNSKLSFILDHWTLEILIDRPSRIPMMCNCRHWELRSWEKLTPGQGTLYGVISILALFLERRCWGFESYCDLCLQSFPEAKITKSCMVPIRDSFLIRAGCGHNKKLHGLYDPYSLFWNCSHLFRIVEYTIFSCSLLFCTLERLFINMRPQSYESKLFA